MGLNILVVNGDVPPRNRDSGSLRLFRIIETMLALGHRVTVLAREGLNQSEAVRALFELGVEEVVPVDAERLIARQPRLAAALAKYPRADVTGLLEKGRFDVAWLSFHHVAEQYAPLIRTFSPGTRIVVDSVDVHWIREQRGAVLAGDHAGATAAELTRERERSSYSAADVNVAVTETDADAIRELAPGVPIQVVPNIHPIARERPTPDPAPVRTPGAEIVFVGNFNHRPNVDAMVWFCSECWSRVHGELPQAELMIVGTDPPAEVQALAGAAITVTGWVPEVAPYLERARVSIAPLRYGAGMKGKIGEAVAAGVPVVTTTIGAEGMGFEHLEHAIIADDAEGFAEGVVRLLTDEALSASLAGAARELLAQTAGYDRARAAIAATLAAAVPDRWQADAGAPWLGELLAAYARRFTADDPAELVLTVRGGPTDELERAGERVTALLAELGLDLDSMADIEIRSWSDSLPSPRRTLFWSPPTAGTHHRAPSETARLAIGTIATASYLPWVRTLAESVNEHHPHSPFVALILDDPDPSWLRPTDSFEVATPADLNLTASERGWMQLIYQPYELACALKPWLLEMLLTRADSALYLDSDTLVLGDLDDIPDLARDTGLVLTPHRTEPLPSDGCFPSDETFLQYGLFNAGFVAAGPEGRRFLEFWKGRLRRDCTDFGEDKPYFDQRWLDLAVGYFPLSIMRDPGVNVGYWNLGPQEIERRGDRYEIGGHPLRLMHFSGFSPENPLVLSRHPGGRGRAATRSAGVTELASAYASRLLEAGWSGRPGADPTRASMTLSRTVRRAIRSALIEAEGHTSPVAIEPADPLALLEWLCEPIGGGPLTRYLWGLRASDPLVAQAFPNVPGDGEETLARWAASDLGSREFVPDAMIDSRLLDRART